MGVKGKLVSQTSVKWEGDLFNLFLFPYKFSQITPHKVQSVDLLSGRWGTAGTLIFWTYDQDGAKCVSKQIIEAIDERKKSITYKLIEGDLNEYYKTFKIIVDVETNSNGEDNMVTCTLEYEKENEAVPDPTAFMDLAIIDCLKEVERTRQLVPK